MNTLPKEGSKPFKDMLPLTEDFKKNPVPTKKEMPWLPKEVWDKYHQHKQETLEEFIKLYINRIDRSEDGLVEQCLKDGAKWKQERMYRDEDMKSAFKVGFSIGYGSDVHAIDEKNKTCEEWFNKIKKK